MTTFDRFERDLPIALEDLYGGPTPSYRDDILRQTAATRQRPGWTFIERWFPMSAITERMATAPRFPLRAAVAVALLVLALVAGALYVGSQQRRLPAPFGPAGNGVIPYVAGGELYLGDPVSGESRLLVGADQAPSLGGAFFPLFSPDGTKVAFARDRGVGGGDIVDVFVVDDDGSDLVKVTAEPIAFWKWMGWTPDGRLAIVHQVSAGTDQLDVYDAVAGGSAQTVTSAVGIENVQFRPPDGREILYRAQGNGTDGLYAMNADGTNVHPLVVRPEGSLWGGAVYSADGNRIFFTRDYPTETPTGTCCNLWVMNADGSNAQQFIPNEGTAWDGQPVVSPDGTRVAFWNGRVSVVGADGTGPVIQTGPDPAATAHWVWAPDSSKILMYSDDDSSPNAYLLDPDGGPSETVPWRSDADLDWQRVAAD